MKKIIFISTLAIIILGISSCKKFLQEKPLTQLSTATYYKTLQDAEGAISAIYGPIRSDGVFERQYMQLVDIPSDYAYGRGSTAPAGQYTILDQTNITRTGTIWTGLYQAINYANIAIQAIPNTTNIDTTTSEALVSEAKFLRAFCYFHLVINFGALPLYLSTTHTVTKRIPVPDVYNAIIADLESGELNLPAVPTEEGHPTKWAAKSFLSLVYLFNEQWDSAQNNALQVIQSGPYSLVQVQQPDDFNNIFGASANGTSEEIFYLKYNHVAGQGWEWPENLNWPGSQFAPFGNYVVYGNPNNPFITSWNNNDLRKKFDLFTSYVDQATGDTVQLPSTVPLLCSKYRDPGATGTSGFANDYPFLRYADVLLIYAEANDMANQGPSPLAIECLNEVKRRGYGYPSNSPSPVDYPSSGWTQQSFRDSVLQERAYEQYMEAKRWEDLKRTNTAAAVILNAKGIVINPDFLLWPIPQQEIDANPQISQSDQNPGY
ncbi:MAG TPA: RagB/SusD family nutrient uptake outer membrane protein [Hanamia sp.]|nr:RagB/SusD family nutrient uptake outer membrane protein [Hanamia sp.]